MRGNTGRMPTASRAGAVAGGTVATAVHVGERPMTQQGLGGLQTSRGATSRGRVIQDESYFVGSLRQKNNELLAEITTLRAEIKTKERDQNSYQSYEKKAELLAKQIKEVQGDLADLNVLEDQISQHVESSEVLDDYEDLKAKNDRQSGDNDELFSERKRVENAIKQTDEEIVSEKAKEESMVDELDEERKQQYLDTKAENEDLSKSVDEMQGQLDAINEEISQAEGILKQNPVKREAVNLYNTIAELEGKKRDIQKEIEADDKGTPEEQRERLLKKVKDDNQSIATMERKIAELKNKVDEIQSELADLDDNDQADDGNDEKREKYKQLVQRDNQMNTFLEDFDRVRSEHKETLEAAETNIVGLLEKISRDMERGENMPTFQEHREDQSQLDYKTKEYGRSENTAKALQDKMRKLQKDNQNVNLLDTKIGTEMDDLKKEIEKMETELVTYKDIGGLREVTETRKRRLLTDKSRLVTRRDTSKRVLAEQASTYDSAKSTLTGNETYAQLLALEKKWVGFQRNNHVMQSFIDAQEAESRFKPYVKKVNGYMNEFNTDLRTREPIKNVSRTV